MEGLLVLIFVGIFIVGFIIAIIFIVKKFNKPTGYKVKTIKDNPMKETKEENKNELLEEVKKLREIAEKEDKEREEKKKIEGIQGIIYLIGLAVIIYLIYRNWDTIVSIYQWLVK